jgi:predicted nucleic acid-binding protein
VNAPVFFDTNILVYADDRSAPEKQERARSLVADHLRDDTCVLSLQVLQEYFVAATRKLEVAADIAQRKVEILSRARVVRLETGDILSAIELHRLSRISFWDALIVHAARLAGVATLLSEDLQPGSVLAGVRIVNPFLE